MMDQTSLQRTSRIYKIVPAPAWAEALEIGFFAGSADDVRDGFIHLSSGLQIACTLNTHFARQKDLLLIAFDIHDLDEFLKWEPSRGGELFPHFYGPLPTKLARWQQNVTFGADGAAIYDDGTS